MKNLEVIASTPGNFPAALEADGTGAPMITETYAADDIMRSTDESTGRDALAPGTELHNGAFRISRVLGKSGVGITYQCRNVALHRDVAIKEFFPSGALRAGSADGAVAAPGRAVVPKQNSAELYQQACSAFLEKARAVSRVWHPNVVMVYDTFAENNTAYMVMKFLKGKTLQQFLEEQAASQAALPEAQAVAYATHIGRGLEALHKAGLIHGSVHPAGVMLCPPSDSPQQPETSNTERRAPLPRVPTGEWTLAGERVVLLDCGLNHVPASNNAMQTRWLPDAQQAAWYRYAPFELWSDSATPEPAADVYALGAVLYHMLTGRPPIEAPERAQGTALEPPHRANARISPELSEAVMWALELRSDHRPETMTALLKHLSQCGSEDSPSKSSSGAASPNGKTAPVQAPSRAGATQAEKAPPPPNTPTPSPAASRPILQTPEPVAASGGAKRSTSGRHLALIALLGTAIAGTAAWALWSETTTAPRPVVPNLTQSRRASPSQSGQQRRLPRL
jgi:serine/threonine protein kinase